MTLLEPPLLLFEQNFTHPIRNRGLSSFTIDRDRDLLETIIFRVELLQKKTDPRPTKKSH